MSRPSVQDNTAGHDSFLDIVANIVGILIILVMVVGVRVKNAPVEPEEDLREAAASLDKDQARAASIRADALELDRQLKQVKLETMARYQERAHLATMVSALEQQIAAARDDLDAESQRDFDLRQAISLAKADLDGLEQEKLRVASFEPEPTVVQCYPTPLSQTVDGDEAHFQLRGGRIAFIPLEGLLVRFQADARQKAYKLLELPEITDVVGPEGGFRLRYTLERHQAPPEEQLRRGGTGLQARLKQWTLIPASSDLGETVDAALTRPSEFLGTIGGYDPQITTITLWTYPDSSHEFRRIKEELYHMGFKIAARPLPEGTPIAGSPHGTKSAAQ